MWHKPFILTCLNRTEEENKAVGGSKYSAHKYARGGDGRSRIYSDSESTFPGEKVNFKFEVKNSKVGLTGNLKFKYKNVPMVRKSELNYAQVVMLPDSLSFPHNVGAAYLNTL